MKEIAFIWTMHANFINKDIKKNNIKKYEEDKRVFKNWEILRWSKKGKVSLEIHIKQPLKWPCSIIHTTGRIDRFPDQIIDTLVCLGFILLRELIM